MSATKASLEKFVTYCQQHIKGDEKGEAQIFLDRFFQAFGHEGALEAGAIYEERIKKVSKVGRIFFADLVWKPRVLIEVIASGDFYILGILNSTINCIWVEAQCSTLENQTCYTNTTCFETFLFPQIVTKN